MMDKIVKDICDGDLLDNNGGDYEAHIERNTGTVLVATIKDNTDDTEYVVMVSKQESIEEPTEQS